MTWTIPNPKPMGKRSLYGIDMPASTPRTLGRLGRVWWFLLLSLLLHAAGLLSVQYWSTLSKQTVPAPPVQPMRVTIAPPEVGRSPEVAKQIVDAPPVNQLIPKDKAFLGVRNQAVPEETIARNLGKAENLQDQEGAEAEAMPQQQDRKGIELAKLLPDPYKSANAGGAASRQQNAVERQFGPVTLLNTKSHPYAQYLIDRGYRAVRLLSLNAELTTWYFGDVQNLRFPAYASVSIDRHGEVLASKIEQSSGSVKVDSMLLNAIRGAVRGTAPPSEAVENGRVDIVLVLEPNVMKIGIR